MHDSFGHLLMHIFLVNIFGNPNSIHDINKFGKKSSGMSLQRYRFCLAFRLWFIKMTEL